MMNIYALCGGISKFVRKVLTITKGEKLRCIVINKVLKLMWWWFVVDGVSVIEFRLWSELCMIFTGRRGCIHQGTPNPAVCYRDREGKEIVIIDPIRNKMD